MFKQKSQLVSREAHLAHMCILLGLLMVLKHFEHPADVKNGKISQKNRDCQLLWRHLSSGPAHQLFPRDRPHLQSPGPDVASPA